MNNLDYLKYDASSIVEYLRKCIIENEIYTDQLYPGSDTSLLINMFAWTFECMQYILNNNAANVLFQDTALYENMNRLVKLLSYSPKAYITSTAEFTIDGVFDENLSENITIPKYAKINTGLFDEDGFQIYYSFVKDYTFTVKNGNIIRNNNKPILYNGEFVKYTFDIQASGRKYEVFAMNGIGPNSQPKTLIDNGNIDVYIEYTDETGATVYENVKIVNNLILDASMDDMVCEKRLNENKELTIKFGDGIHGKLLPEGAKIHLIYLKSNGVTGKITSNQISVDDLILNVPGFTDNYTFVNMLFGGQDRFRALYEYLFTNESLCIFETNKLVFTNLDESSNVLDYEDVEEIREYAPDSFRFGNRLVTASDFRTYILNNFKNRVKDVYVCGNNEYCMNFYRWLDKYGKLSSGIRMNTYEYADANDFNNIYIWMMPNSRKLLDSDKKIIVKDCEKRKTLTTNLIPCNGIKTYFMPFIKDDTFSEDDVNAILLSTSYYPSVNILIEKERTHISDERIKLNIISIITDYFKEKSKLGAIINLSEIYQKIMALNYISSIKTVSTNPGYKSYINGLSFAYFTQDLVDFKDFDTFTQIVQLNKFQYPEFVLSEQKLSSIIRIVNENSFTLKNDEI